MRCDYIAEGVINAAKELSLTVPLIVRLKGTKEAEAKEYVHLCLTDNLETHTTFVQDDPSVRPQDYSLR